MFDENHAFRRVSEKQRLTHTCKNGCFLQVDGKYGRNIADSYFRPAMGPIIVFVIADWRTARKTNAEVRTLVWPNHWVSHMEQCYGKRLTGS